MRRRGAQRSPSAAGRTGLRTPAGPRFVRDAASLRCGVPQGRVGRAEGEGARDEFRRTCS
ncbi:hypothetical protein EOT10_32850 [Streptomyces antnestii]|uniref:Uncharacterized protein n=1 Tax=Streptomyces antnestii TaxID=2494256 RepID=A0A3S2V9Q9_9ACTN|nr:hypothetical protein EOT10_32850 [Streptomyces sp. San01]